MIHELRVYTLRPGTQATYLQLSRDVGRPIRGDEYGTLLGAWMTEIGTLNQYVHLWSYADPNERERLRRALAQNERWSNEYVPQIRPLMLAQENAILNPVGFVPFTPPGEGRHVYELRSYRMHPGGLAEWSAVAPAGLEARVKYSRPVGMWTSEVGVLNRLIHLWAYDDLNHRADVRARGAQDPDWQAYLGKTTHLFAEQQSAILNPTETSPLR